MQIFRLRSFDEYVVHSARASSLNAEHMTFINAHTPKHRRPFSILGYSYSAEKQVNFLVDYQHAGEVGPVIWRERVCCPETHFNNRMRATFHLFDVEMSPYPDLNIYVTEQVTPIFKYFEGRFQNIVGSEYLNGEVPLGKSNSDGIRNEDLCALTFKDESFDAVISLDVLEHIPNYIYAFRECARVLKPHGRLMWSVPFIPSSRTNSIRARVVNGEIQHILAPEYHGNPLSPKGILCFQHFGWEMLDEMRSAGFSDAYAVCYQSIPFGYLGGEQFMFFAVK